MPMRKPYHGVGFTAALSAELGTMEERPRGKVDCPGFGQIAFLHSGAHVPHWRDQTGFQATIAIGANPG